MKKKKTNVNKYDSHCKTNEQGEIWSNFPMCLLQFFNSELNSVVSKNDTFEKKKKVAGCLNIHLLSIKY